MNPITDILDDLRAGKMIVLVDDVERENEGDLVCAAEFAAPATINFMLREARGMLCVPLAGAICDRLELGPQSSVNTSQRGTAYTVSVDAHERFGITTGVSAVERARTIGVLADPASKPSDLARPGHVQPLRARAGGALVRAGQTEGAVDLCRLAGLKPAAVIIEVMNADGTMARRPDLEHFCAGHSLKMCAVADVIRYRLQREKLVERIDSGPLDTEFGSFTLSVYRSQVDPLPHVALTCGPIGQYDASGAANATDQPVLVRMHSQNLLGDVLGDLRQPTGRTLRSAMKMIQQAGCGALVYLRHDGMGTGLLRRLQTLQRTWTEEQPDKITGAETGNGPTRRMAEASGAGREGDYGIGSQILRDLGVRRLRLITDHPFHPAALEAFGLSIVEFVKVEPWP